MSGYVTCNCRDCFEILVGEPEEYCDECIEAGCPDYQGQEGMSQECQKEPDENEIEGFRVPKEYMIALPFVAKRAAEFLDDENLFHFLTKLMMDNNEEDPAGSARFLMDHFEASVRKKSHSKKSHCKPGTAGKRGNHGG